MEFLVIYIVGWLVFGTAWSNYYLNKRYKYEISALMDEDSYYDSYRYRRSDESYEEYAISIKANGYREALDFSKVDRYFSFFLCGGTWPLSMFILAGFHFNQHPLKGKIGPIGLSKAGRDVKRSRKEITKAEERRAIEAKEREEWNAMVDILNENKLNEITKFEKR